MFFHISPRRRALGAEAMEPLARRRRGGELVAFAARKAAARHFGRKGTTTVRVTIDPAFEIELPAGWSAAPDEEGGVSATASEGAGLLHLIAFEQPLEQDLDPADELYIFLEDQGIELEEDEIEDVQLADGAELAVCEYVAEDDEEEGEAAEPTYWIVGVATIPGSLVFASYSCPADVIEQERDTVRSILTTLRLTAPHGEEA